MSINESRVLENLNSQTITATQSTPLLETEHEEDHGRRGTIVSSIFTLVSTMIGGGILSLPFAFQQGGFIMTSFVLFFVLLASTHGGFLIINSKKYCQGRIKNVEDVGRIAFGSKGEVGDTKQHYHYTFYIHYQCTETADS